MKALAINGSPRKGGNVEILLRRALEPIFAAGHETEIVRIGGTRLRGCIACGGCGRNRDKRCVLEDDGFNAVFAKMLEADAILIGTPAYFADMTADTKALIERAGYVALANGGLLRRKIGAAVVDEAVHVLARHAPHHHLVLPVEPVDPPEAGVADHRAGQCRLGR